MTETPEEVWKKFTESDWFKNLPEYNYRDELEQYRVRLDGLGIDLDNLDEKYLEFICTLMRHYVAYIAILPLKYVFKHIDEALADYEHCFELGFKDMYQNAKIAVGHIKEKYYA